MAVRNALYAQSGGVTAVINATACGVIETARRHRSRIGKVYAGRDGIIGVLTEDLIDTSRETPARIRALRHTPAGAFGSCRYKLKGLDENRAQYERLMEVAQDISAHVLSKKVGRTIDVLVDDVQPEMGRAIGRSQWDAPEIDGTVIIHEADDVHPIPRML